MNKYYRETCPARKENAPNIQLGKISFYKNDIETVIDIKDLGDIVRTDSNQINNIKSIIKQYFSDEMQTDETPMGALKRNQIVKQLLDFAKERV
jgi:hypothetical protein